MRRIYLQDYERLCKLIKHTPILKKLVIALQYLDNKVLDIPLYVALRDGIEANWLEHKSFHKCTIDQYETLAKGFQGAHLALTLYQKNESMDYRHFSIKAFKDSKITPIEQPILLSGNLIFTQHGSVLDASFPPAVGLFPSEELIVSTQISITGVATIENQASFMRYVKEEKQPIEIVLYTSGIPTPRFIALFQKISNTLGPQTSFLHWGDIDLGGFKIWNILNKSIEREIKPYRMSPDDYQSSQHLKDLSESEKIQLEILSNPSIAKLIQRITSVGKKYEQEMWKKL